MSGYRLVTDYRHYAGHIGWRLELAERFHSLAFKFVVMFLGWLYLSGMTIILYLTVENGASLLIRDALMPFEVPMLIFVLLGLGGMLLKTLQSLIKEYLRIIRPSTIL